MSTHSTEHEAYLRAVLHAAADSVEPRGDGLERIRARLRQPRPTFSTRVEAAFADIFMRAPARLQDVGYQLADWLRFAYERFAPAQAPGKHRSRTQGLLRPLAAMAVVMFIVAAGTYVAIDASTAIFPSSSSNAPSGSGQNAGAKAGPQGRGTTHTSGFQPGPAGSGRSAPAASCKPGTPAPDGSPTSAPASPSPSASASPGPTDSPSVDPSASPTDTSTDSPTATVAPSPQASANGNGPTATPATTPVLTTSPAC